METPTNPAVYDQPDRERLTFSSLSGVGVFLIHKVESGHRLRLPPDTDIHIPWLKHGPRRAFLFPTPRGGVQVRRESPMPLDELALVAASLKQKPAQLHEWNATWLDLLTAFPSAEVEFTQAPNRYSVVLPRNFRKAGLLPEVGENAAIVISGEIFEIWDSRRWIEWLQKTHSRLAIVAAQAAEQIEER
jgi:hypothetical protein